MSKEAEILKTGISCHNTLLPRKNKSRGNIYLRCVGLTKADA